MNAACQISPCNASLNVEGSSAAPLARPGKRFNQSKDKWFQYQMSPTHSMSLPDDWRLMRSFHSHKHPHFDPIPVKGNNQCQIKHHDPIPGMPIYISLPSTLKITMTLPLKTTMAFSWPKETMKALPCLAQTGYQGALEGPHGLPPTWEGHHGLPHAWKSHHGLLLALWSHHCLPFALNTTQVNHDPNPLTKESQHDFTLPPNQIIHV